MPVTAAGIIDPRWRSDYEASVCWRVTVKCLEIDLVRTDRVRG